MKIYVAGPYSGPDDNARLGNVQRTMKAGLELIRKGHAPFIPHLNHWVDLYAEAVTGERLSWQDWMDVVAAFIPVCEGFLYLDSSPGADVELQIAKATGRRIFYCIEEVPFG